MPAMDYQQWQTGLVRHLVGMVVVEQFLPEELCTMWASLPWAGLLAYRTAFSELGEKPAGQKVVFMTSLLGWVFCWIKDEA